MMEIDNCKFAQSYVRVQNAVCEMGNCKPYTKLFRIKRLKKKDIARDFKFIKVGNRKIKHRYIHTYC